MLGDLFLKREEILKGLMLRGWLGCSGMGVVGIEKVDDFKGTFIEVEMDIGVVKIRGMGL